MNESLCWALPSRHQRLAERDPVALVFALPELLTLILEHFEVIHSVPRPSWGRLGMVAHNWLSAALAQDWKNELSLQRLSKIPGDRRQYYANHIQILTFGDFYTKDEVLPNIVFPKLRHVILGSRALRTAPSTWTHSILAPSVRTLSLHSPKLFTPELLVRICSLVPKLDELVIRDLPSNISADMLAQFIGFLPRLRTLRIPSNVNKSSPLRLSALTELADLEHLVGLGGTMPTPTGTDQRFTSLTKLECTSSYAGLQTIGRDMPCLTQLKITLVDRSHSRLPIFSPLSALQKLTKLKLLAGGAEELAIDVADFCTIARLRSLTRLHIAHDWFEHEYVYITIPNLTVHDFAEVFRNLPSLEKLKLLLRHKLGTKALLVLAEHSRRLETLQIHKCFNYKKLRSDHRGLQPMLPCLESLRTDRIVYGGVGSSHEHTDELVEAVVLHFPRLSHVQVEDSPYLEDRINVALRLGLPAWKAAQRLGPD